MERIVFLPIVVKYINDLVDNLFEKEYFCFKVSAYEYVDKLVDFVIDNIETYPHKVAPKPLQKLGSHYIPYQPNKRTTWYVFFEIEKDTFLITGILNNHVKEAKFLNL